MRTKDMVELQAKWGVSAEALEDAYELGKADGALEEQSHFADAERSPHSLSDRERIEFIRRAAIALTGGVQEMGPERAWQWAEALWKAKPDGL